MPLMPPIPLSEQQEERLRSFERLLCDVNQRFNLVSRGEEGAIWEHHILHCLVCAVRGAPRRGCVVDWGTGGGLPAIPLSIAWPETPVFAVDSNAKKTRAVTLFARRLGLDNCTAVPVRAEQITARDFREAPPDGRPYEDHGSLLSVSRATAPLSTLWAWHERARGLRAPGDRGPEGRAERAAGLDTPSGAQPAASGPAPWEPGLLCLKGGDLREELGAFAWQYPQAQVRAYDVRDYLDDPWFETKKLLHITEPHGTES